MGVTHLKSPQIDYLLLKNTLTYLLTYWTQGDYAPKPADIRNVTLTRANLEMAERMAENAHDSWALKKKRELESLGQSHRLVHIYSRYRTSYSRRMESCRHPGLPISHNGTECHLSNLCLCHWIFIYIFRLKHVYHSCVLLLFYEDTRDFGIFREFLT